MTGQPVVRQPWSVALTGWVLLGCGASPGAAAPATVSPEAPPMPGSLWAPSEPVPAAPGGFAWSEVSVQTACAEGAPTLALSQHTITSSAEFERAFCRKAQLDFGRFRLVILKVAYEAEAVEAVPNAERISVVVQTRLDCDAGWEASLALLLPAGPKPVVLIERPVPAPDCRDGYGY